MSIDFAARTELHIATVLFGAGRLGDAGVKCLKLGNELQSPSCPRVYRVKAMMLHSRCHPDNYWFAKDSLDRALAFCNSRDDDKKANEHDLAALADAQNSVETMLRDRATQYEEYWKSQGIQPPTMEEWYEIAEAGDEAQKPADGLSEVAKDEDGEPLSGPKTALSFEGPVPSSSLKGKIFPAEARQKVKELQRLEKQERQHASEQETDSQKIRRIIREMFADAQTAGHVDGRRRG